MAIITYEGFENYSSFDAVKSYLNYTNTGTIQIISATDANGVTPRNGGSCLKMTSSGSTFPRVYLRTPTGTHNVSGIVGFAIYPMLPAGGTFGTFTPIGANIRGSASHSNPVVNFTIGINSNLNLEIRRPVHNAYSGSWGSPYETNNNPDSVYTTHYLDAALKGYACGKNGCSTAYLSVALAGPLVATSSSLLTLNQWNYVEIRYILSGTSAGTASTQIKINRNAGDSVLDANSSAYNAGINTNSALGWNPSAGSDWYTRGFAFGTIHSDTARVWNTYIDDFYWADLTGATNNDFLGRVSCKKFSYNNVVNYDMTTPSDSATALSNFNETYSGIGTIATRNVGNILGQTLDVRSTGVSSETLSPIFVRQYVQGYRTDTASDIGIGMINGADDVPVTNVGTNSDSINATLKFRDYDNAPDGSEWTNQKIADTTFKHTITAAS